MWIEDDGEWVAVLGQPGEPSREITVTLGNLPSSWLVEHRGELEATLRAHTLSRSDARGVKAVSQAIRMELVRRVHLVGCPRRGCDAGPGERCENLQTHEEKEWPHGERIAAYAEAAGVDGPLGIEWVDR